MRNLSSEAATIRISQCRDNLSILQDQLNAALFMHIAPILKSIQDNEAEIKELEAFLKEAIADES
jgi:hypothetical protein